MLSQSFKIESSLYPDDAMLQAIDDFSDIASIRYADSTLSIESDTSIDEIFHEFMNYVLALSSERLGQDSVSITPIEVA